MQGNVCWLVRMNNEYSGELPHVRIAFVLVWAGAWRPWINLHWHTCAHNPDIDFLIFTEQPAPLHLPPNVRFARTGLAEIARRAGEIAGVSADAPLELKSAYKLCDYKSLYGLIFARELAGYTHWAYCDEDVFWGDVRKFFTDERCAQYDVISSCRCSVVGQMTLFRNAPEIARLPLEIPRYWEWLRDPGIHLLDEMTFNSALLAAEAQGRVRVLRRQLQTHDSDSPEWTAWADRLEIAETGRAHGPLVHGAAVWREGRVFSEATGGEFAFFHFGSWKRRWSLPPIPMPPRDVIGWRVSESGIVFELAVGAGVAAHWFVWRYKISAKRAGARSLMLKISHRVIQQIQRVRRRVVRLLPRGM